jgi:hypothetical protein
MRGSEGDIEGLWWTIQENLIPKPMETPTIPPIAYMRGDRHPLLQGPDELSAYNRGLLPKRISSELTCRKTGSKR